VEVASFLQLLELSISKTNPLVYTFPSYLSILWKCFHTSFTTTIYNFKVIVFWFFWTRCYDLFPFLFFLLFFLFTCL